MSAEWRGDVATLTLLNRMVEEDLPLGLHAGPAEPFFQRDVYFDTADRALRRRGVTCRFRTRVDDTRLLTLRIVGAPAAAGVSRPVLQTFEAQVPELDAGQALAGASDPARRLRAMTEPERLRPRIQFETERRVRRTRRRWFARGQYEILYDVVTVRSGPRAQTFQELKVRELRAGRPGLEAVARALAERYGLRPLLVGKLDRAERVIRDLESASLAQGAHDGREVTLIVLQDGDVALSSDAAGLTLPVARGSGEEACRELLRAHFGSADGHLRLLGTAPGGEGGSRPPLEVWLAVRAGSSDRGSPRLQWLPLRDILSNAGAPGLRDPRTLAALTIVTRAETAADAWRKPGAAAAARGAQTPERRRRMSDVIRLPAIPDAGRPSAEHLLNGDFSVLEFHARVLALAEDARVPLLARLRFLSILSTNLDEFFMVRVGTLQRALAAGLTEPGEDGLTPDQQLDAIHLRVRALLERQTRCFRDECLPALAAHQVRLRRWSDLTEPERAALGRFFHEQIFPVITPQAITRAPGHPFPLVPTLRLSLAVAVRDPLSGATHFAYFKVPDGVPRFVAVPEEAATAAGAAGPGPTFVPVEDVIRAHLPALYPGLEVLHVHGFRVTRAADLELDERQAVSLLQVIGEETKRRPYGAPVRLEVERAMPAALRDLVLRELQFEDAAVESLLAARDVYEADELLDLGALRELARLPLPALDYPPHQGRTPIPPEQSVFAVLAERDVLVHHPHDAFEATVERLFVEAADDPGVVAIKLTLYRAGGRSGIVDALLRAAARGKEVFVFVELKARFDEERNIEWARRLEQQGIRVVYGLVDLKTHAKTALIVRREAAGIRRYVHIGTGNYNAATAAMYTDVGLLSADPVLGADLHDLFNALSGSSQAPRTPFRAILVSPTFLLPRLLQLIERETEHARAGRPAGIRAKLNGLADPDVVEALYRASQAGVNIELVVRGVCRLRPGVPGLSERIRVVSILGRFLEHARILRFTNGGDPDYYIGSADWRPRNLRRRVEVVAPVRDAACRARLDEILERQLADPDGWELAADGGYARREPAGALSEPE
ncbi:MAG: polyphosphate kinase 1 [Gemmatimonadales bacterium]